MKKCFWILNNHALSGIKTLSSHLFFFILFIRSLFVLSQTNFIHSKLTHSHSHHYLRKYFSGNLIFFVSSYFSSFFITFTFLSIAFFYYSFKVAYHMMNNCELASIPFLNWQLWNATKWKLDITQVIAKDKYGNGNYMYAKVQV